MGNALNRSIEAQAMKILRMERALVVVTGVLTLIMLGAAIYFEKVFGILPYSFAIVLVSFAVSYVCFWALFSFFKGDFQHRAPGKGKARMALWAATGYIAIASTVVYVVSFAMMGLNMPWAGPGRENLYICYFLAAVCAIFLSRSVAFYAKLRSYVIRSLNSMAR
ncbi:hypothetical protein [Methanocella sp. MCL-LM]|uniref:hypothetical protein n=1 Tax=Methanocella sp. MCL-LM TaxID=3412035 RepID=UPI003C7686E9